MIARALDANGFVAPTALYVHVPVCASKCSYCDFFSLPASNLRDGFEPDLVEAILSRASRLAERFGASSFGTVYIGGGTPSLLSSPGLDRLLGGIGKVARGSDFLGPSEWTVEANPDSLTPEKIEVMCKRGVTRLSLGVQSLNCAELSILGRRHGPEQALDAITLASRAGLTVSADLIAGIPSSKSAGLDAAAAFGTGRLSSFARELIDAGARHLSVYDLTLEEGSPLAARKNQLSFPGDDRDWEERQELDSCLLKAGMRRYEVSNYAGAGYECRHNLAYWRMDSYIGAGPGAVSTIARSSGSSLRIEEARELTDYGRYASEQAIETDIGILDSAFETVMMAFRTSFGLDLQAFGHRYGVQAHELIGATLEKWAASLKAGEPWPGSFRSSGPALDADGLSFLNRFLVDCLDEIDRKKASMPSEFACRVNVG